MGASNRNFLGRLKGATKLIFAIAILCAAFIITGYILILSIAFFICSTETGPKSYSSDNTYYFQIEQTNCGATTQFVSNVFLNKPIWGITIPRINKRSIFGYEGPAHMVDAKWINDRVLQMKALCHKSIGERDVYWNGVKILYLEQCSE